MQDGCKIHYNITCSNAIVDNKQIKGLQILWQKPNVTFHLSFLHMLYQLFSKNANQIGDRILPHQIIWKFVVGTSLQITTSCKECVLIIRCNLDHTL